MLRACILDLKGSWEEHLSLVEFSYDNSYQASIQMAPYEADEYLKYTFYPYVLVSFSSVFMLNKFPNALKVHSYDQVIHLVEL